MSNLVIIKWSYLGRLELHSPQLLSLLIWIISGVMGGTATVCCSKCTVPKLMVPMYLWLDRLRGAGLIRSWDVPDTRLPGVLTSVHTYGYLYWERPQTFFQLLESTAWKIQLEQLQLHDCFCLATSHILNGGPTALYTTRQVHLLSRLSLT